MNLQDLGWHAFFENQTEKNANVHIGRIANIQKSSLLILHDDGEKPAKPSGALSHQMETTGDTLAVGDWVVFNWQPEDQYAIIRKVLQRQNAITRMAAGSRGRSGDTTGKYQIIAANVDLVFIVSGLDRDFNPRRIERYLALVYESDARPVVVLNKADLCPDPESKRAEVESIALGVPVVVMNARDISTFESLKGHIQPGHTAGFLGSSGAGKSTIINGLLGLERQKTSAVSDSVGKGRHTTTSRELIPLPTGGLVIDTPGMRELQLSGGTGGVDAVFDDIEQLARQCRFSDCAHMAEPGCAVREALENGKLDHDRLENYFKLKREEDYYLERESKESRQIEKEKWRQIKIETRRMKKQRKKLN